MAETVTDRWRFDYRPSPALPPLAWVARIHGHDVSVDCGTSVRCEPGGFFEGTWVGPPGVESVLESTAPFGTGMVARGPDLFAIPPGHTMALLFSWRGGDELFIANTFVGLLAKTGLELLPDADYQGLFARTAHGLQANPTSLPTTGGPAEYHLFENLRILPAGHIEISPKPREKPFASFDDYVERLDAALASALSNAPGYEAGHRPIERLRQPGSGGPRGTPWTAQGADLPRGAPAHVHARPDRQRRRQCTPPGHEHRVLRSHRVHAPRRPSRGRVHGHRLYRRRGALRCLRARAAPPDHVYRRARRLDLAAQQGAEPASLGGRTSPRAQ